MFNNLQFPNIGAAILLLIVWEAFWKGIGLWRSAKKGDLVWFIAIFLINFLGLVPIIYLWSTKQLEPSLIAVKDFFTSKFKK